MPMGLAVAILLLTLNPLSAQVYLEVHGGLNIAHESDIDDSGDGLKSITYDPGYAVGGAVGYRINPNWRLEGEVTYRRNKVDDLEVGSNKDGARGRAESSAFLANGYYDFANSTAWTPYLGLGIGVAAVGWFNVKESGTNLIDDASFAFAYQLGGGVAYEFAPGLALTLDYRYFRTTDVTIQEESAEFSEFSYQNSSVWLGLRYTF